MKNKSTKTIFIALGLIAVSVVYVSAFTASIENNGNKFNAALASGSLTSTSINSGTSIGTATGTSIGTATGTGVGTATGIGVATSEEILGIQIYPNPVVDKLNVRYSQEASGVTKIKVLNVMGEVVYQGEKSEIIDLSTLAAGNYFVQFVDADLHTTTKSVVKAEAATR